MTDVQLKNEMSEEKSNEQDKFPPRKYRIAYNTVLLFLYLHLAAIHGIFLCFTKAKWQTVVFAFLLYVVAELGLTAGVHRLWSHRSYKAKLPLQLILAFFSTLGYQNSIIYWVRDHRLHHKYSDTDLDPHNANRGFFYSHVGWLLTRKSDDVIKHGRMIDMSDMYGNPILRFQDKYAWHLAVVICYIFPTLVPVYFWGEALFVAWTVNVLRYVANLNVTFMINSAAHKWGYRSYDKNIRPSQNLLLSFAIMGEGFHNYHHVFPWDYQTSEFGNKTLNVTTWFIDFFAWVGWAYDLKTVSQDDVDTRKLRTGDGSALWGGLENKQKH